VGTPSTQPNTGTLTPGRGLREFSIPCDPATILGTTGIHYNQVLGGSEILAGMPLAGANATGASYLSAIHGGLGSDEPTPGSAPASGFNPAVPAFPGPEVTGYYTTPPLSNNAKQNGYLNTEKIQRSASDNPAQNGTVWMPINGRSRLNFSLWIARNLAPVYGLYYQLLLFRDLNPLDKVAGFFGGSAADPFNGQLIGTWTASAALLQQNKPNLVTTAPFDIPAGCNLYLMFQASDFAGGNNVVGSIWLS
jgi:hypothetical protein